MTDRKTGYTNVLINVVNANFLPNTAVPNTNRTLFTTNIMADRSNAIKCAIVRPIPVAPPMMIPCGTRNAATVNARTAFPSRTQTNVSILFFQFLFILYEIPFIVSAIRFFFISTLSTLTSTISPTLTTSNGCLINFLSVISEICTNPS